MTSLEVVAASARAVGIDIRTEYPDAPVWTDSRNVGDFDIIMNTPLEDKVRHCRGPASVRFWTIEVSQN